MYNILYELTSYPSNLIKFIVNPVYVYLLTNIFFLQLISLTLKIMLCSYGDQCKKYYCASKLFVNNWQGSYKTAILYIL